MPAVAVVMPVLNEENYLEAAVLAILSQDYEGPIQVVLALGPSKDQTNKIAQELEKDPRVKLVDNPSGRTASALNSAIKKSNFEIIVRLDGHALVDPNYIKNAVSTLLATDADTEYRVERDGEAIIFPNAKVAIGQRAMLMVKPVSVAGKVS